MSVEVVTIAPETNDTVPESKPVLMKVYSPDCGYCNQMKGEWLDLPKQDLPPGLVVAAVHVQSLDRLPEKIQAKVKGMSAKGVPLVLAVSQKGDKVVEYTSPNEGESRSAKYRSAADMAAFARKVLGGGQKGGRRRSERTRRGRTRRGRTRCGRTRRGRTRGQR